MLFATVICGAEQSRPATTKRNTMAIMKIITELRAVGETILDEDLTRISPLMYQHVIPNGTYHFARSKPGDDFA
jgi:hypothetical protein